MQAGAVKQKVPVLSLRAIRKSFAGTPVLRDVNIDIHPGETVGLLGDNGAGKSTLIKILAGVHRPDSGEMDIDGQPVDLRRYSIHRARACGIETVFQENSLGEQQQLWRNIFAGRELTNRFGLIRVAEQKRVTMEILRRYVGLQGAAINADSRVATLSGGERQGVAIGRAMYFNARLVILDEPTTALALGEVGRVLGFVHQLNSDGKACLFISHNLGQVYRIADRFLILDRGKLMAEYAKSEISAEQLSREMLQMHSQG
jgi:simple sugar transport system ATP-binding protein